MRVPAKQSMGNLAWPHTGIVTPRAAAGADLATASQAGPPRCRQTLFSTAAAGKRAANGGTRTTRTPVPLTTINCAAGLPHALALDPNLACDRNLARAAQIGPRPTEASVGGRAGQSQRGQKGRVLTAVTGPAGRTALPHRDITCGERATMAQRWGKG